jgi:hypothetical protein
MLIQVVLIARSGAADMTSVSTTVEVDRADPRWPGSLVDTVTAQAHEGACRLREQLGDGAGEPGIRAEDDGRDAGATADAEETPRRFARPPFVPLATAISRAAAGTPHPT